MAGPLEVRALLLLVAASALFTLLCPIIYRRDPARRKTFLAALAAVLLVAPWWSAAGLWTWPLGLRDPSLGLLGEPVPWLLLALWWTVGAALAGRTVAAMIRGRRALGALPPFYDVAVEQECRSIAAGLGLARPVEIRLGRAPGASSLAGLVMVLPAAARDWPEITRRAVLGHELAHLQRLDDRLLLMMRLLTDWYWWMPWLGRLRRRYVEAMEESCDDLASTLLASREDYVAGLVRAARSITGPAAQPSPQWVSLLGHSHLSARVQRLLIVPRPTLDHADGRWTLLWACLAFVIVLTAQPAAVPRLLPATAELLPLHQAAAVPQAAAAPKLRRPRVETATYLHHPASGTWRRIPDSARDPQPVYPAEALERGVEGEVTVALWLRPTRSGAVRAAPPEISSSDPSGLLVPAVKRALEHARGRGLGAGLRAVSVHDNDIATPPPGTVLRLKKIYRFVLAHTGGAAQPHRYQEVEP